MVSAPLRDRAGRSLTGSGRKVLDAGVDVGFGVGRLLGEGLNGGTLLDETGFPLVGGLRFLERVGLELEADLKGVAEFVQGRRRNHECRTSVPDAPSVRDTLCTELPQPPRCSGEPCAAWPRVSCDDQEPAASWHAARQSLGELTWLSASRRRSDWWSGLEAVRRTVRRGDSGTQRHQPASSKRCAVVNWRSHNETLRDKQF